VILEISRKYRNILEDVDTRDCKLKAELELSMIVHPRVQYTIINPGNPPEHPSHKGETRFCTPDDGSRKEKKEKKREKREMEIDRYIDR